MASATLGWHHQKHVQCSGYKAQQIDCRIGGLPVTQRWLAVFQLLDDYADQEVAWNGTSTLCEQPIECQVANKFTELFGLVVICLLSRPKDPRSSRLGMEGAPGWQYALNSRAWESLTLLASTFRKLLLLVSMVIGQPLSPLPIQSIAQERYLSSTVHYNYDHSSC